MWGRSSRGALPWAAILAGASLAACNSGPTAPPNILFIVWDTVRARDLGVYGAERPTTPNLTRWSQDARVFENAMTVGSTTVPAHASMFTGLYPYQHGADNQHDRLASRFETLAEILSQRGYATYLFSANPYLRVETQLAQGFDVVEHPWSPDFREEAGRIARAKVLPYAQRGHDRRVVKSLTHPKTAGAVAQVGLERWLSNLPHGTAWFAFLNYMDAHEPVVPTAAHRARWMTPEQVDASYAEPLTGMAIWNYTAGVTQLSDARLALLRLTYAAALSELDEHFGRLIDALDARGRLRDTIVVLTSDHGELLGEHHMLNHQFSVHEELLRIPLIVYYPPRMAAGRDARPVTNLDLFPTLLELTGSQPDPDRPTRGVSLLTPLDARERLAEYPSPFEVMAFVKLAHPQFDDTPFQRSLRAFRSGRFKYVRASDGHRALYDLDADPSEQRDLSGEQAERAEALDAALERYLASLGAPAEPATAAPVSEEVEDLLEALGYAAPDPQ